MKRVLEFETIRFSNGTESRRQQRMALLKSMSNYELNLIITATQSVHAKRYYSSFRKTDDVDPSSKISNIEQDIAEYLAQFRKRNFGVIIWDIEKQEEITIDEKLI